MSTELGFSHFLFQHSQENEVETTNVDVIKTPHAVIHMKSQWLNILILSVSHV